MQMMFGRTAEEILTALEYYEKRYPKVNTTVHFENMSISGKNFRLETRSDTGLTLWVNGQVVYQYKDNK